ncbi:5105_t:CDS:1, partial [Acaulospora morrowiae]
LLKGTDLEYPIADINCKDFACFLIITSTSLKGGALENTSHLTTPN